MAKRHDIEAAKPCAPAPAETTKSNVERGAVAIAACSPPAPSPSLTAPTSHAPSDCDLLRTFESAISRIDWATLLRRVYDIDALACPCGGRLRFTGLVTGVADGSANRDIWNAMTFPEDLPRRLASLSAWTADEDPQASAATLGRLVEGFRATGRLVGDYRLAELEHEATGTRAVVVPGGSLQVGFSSAEIAELRARLGPPGAPGYDSWLGIYERMFAGAPARHVEIAPFICARAPILDSGIADAMPELVGGCPLEEELEPDLTPLTPEEAAQEEAEGWLDDDRVRPCPAFVKENDTLRLLQALDARCPEDAEWELIARGGGTRSWIADDPWTVVADFHAHPVFEDGSKWTLRTTNALGIWGLPLPEWTRGTDHQLVLRGGAVMGFPWQDSHEVISAHAATPGLWRGAGAVRAVWDLE